MKIVQCGARRSGNYLLWSIIGLLLDKRRGYDEFLDGVGTTVGSVLFTHERPETVTPSGVYVVRDGRDAVASILNYVVTPEYRKRHPECTRTEVSDLLAIEGFYERRVLHWKEHVRSFLQDARPWHVVRYEDLAGGAKEETVRSLAKWMSVDLSEEKLRSILGETSVETCRALAPGHLHSGMAGGFATVLDHDHLATFYDIAGKELDALEYER